MREYINANLKVIKKHLNKRSKKLSKLNSDSMKEEFREWNDSLIENELIWTLPDLTRIERYDNFYRSIKKKLN